MNKEEWKWRIEEIRQETECFKSMNKFLSWFIPISSILIGTIIILGMLNNL